MKICHKCNKQIERQESSFEHGQRYEDGGRYYNYYHSSCWNELKEEEKQEREQRRQENQQRNQERLEEELNNLNSESLALSGRVLSSLGNPSVEDVKEINKFKSKIKKFLKKVENKDFDGKADLQEDLVKLDEFLAENASPQLQDKASSDKKRQKKGQKKCYHENVEKYEDGGYYCSYCWDENSPEFLKVLARKGLKQGESNQQSNNNHKHHNNPNIEREREREIA